MISTEYNLFADWDAFICAINSTQCFLISESVQYSISFAIFCLLVTVTHAEKNLHLIFTDPLLRLTSLAQIALTVPYLVS